MTRLAVRPGRSLLGAAVSVLLFACTPDEPGRVVRDDDKVRYVVHGDAEVSDAAIDRVVAQVVELSALFGVPPKKVEYHFFESRERLSESRRCRPDDPDRGLLVAGCAHLRARGQHVDARGHARAGVGTGQDGPHFRRGRRIPGLS